MINENKRNKYRSIYNEYFSIIENNDVVTSQLIEVTKDGIDEIKDDVATRLLDISRNAINDEIQPFGVFITYGMSIGALELKGKCECITRQDGFKDEAINIIDLDQLLNCESSCGDEDISISNIVNWFVEPRSNLEIEEDVLKRMIYPTLRRVYRSIFSSGQSVITMVIPPVSEYLEIPDWEKLLEPIKMNNVTIKVTNYGELFGVEENEKKYIELYQSDGNREYLIISSYEIINNKISCLGTLAFDISDNEEMYEMIVNKPTTFDVVGSMTDYSKSEIIEQRVECKLTEHKLNDDYGFNSFLGSHPITFANQKYRLSEKNCENHDVEIIANTFNGTEALQVMEICSRVLKEKNLYNIALSDMAYVANLVEKSSKFIDVEVTTKQAAKLETSRSTAKNVDTNQLALIPSNFASITWKIIDKKRAIIDYKALDAGKHNDIEMILSIVDHFSYCTTADVAEELLYLKNGSFNTDPSAFLAAKIFLFMLSMDSITIDSRNEIVQSIINVDNITFEPVKLNIKNVKKKKNSMNTVVFKESKEKNVKIEDLKLSVRSYNSLRKAGINTLDDLSKKTFTDLTKVRNLGKSNILEIIDKMKEFDVELRKEMK